ncbi:c-type cytochrome [Pseudoroseicyclus tamaricis]|uniref:Cytochrome c family protein n=1 Tax=Pseudoroseicyclus tamaricis TaxID=2705421 RepID=A0A6B2JM87_9RHOB|nr:cytochrome c family protein [Pseudoroseicyclus tamaricis]NDU99756.1 cytochrome c family protein [Pseudoroseicyclus tamaricis]
MFDTMTLTKLLGGFAGTFLVFLLGNWAAESVYHVGGHGESEQAYVIEVVDDADAGAEEEEGPAFEEVYASADPAAGEGLFRNCRSCHAVEPGENMTGPTLYGVVGRPVDAVDGYAYSGALEEHADVWTPENLSAFLENPQGFAPGTKMTYAGMRSVQDRADIIAWLDSLDG